MKLPFLCGASHWLVPFFEVKRQISTFENCLALSRNQINHIYWLSVFLHVSVCIDHCPNQFKSILVTPTPRQPGMEMALMDTTLTTQSFPLIQNDFDVVTSTLERGQMAHLNANRSLFCQSIFLDTGPTNQVFLSILQKPHTHGTHTQTHTASLIPGQNVITIVRQPRHLHFEKAHARYVKTVLYFAHF